MIKKKGRKKEEKVEEKKKTFSTSWWKQQWTYDTCFAMLTVNNSYNCNQWKGVSILATRTARTHKTVHTMHLTIKSCRTISVRVYNLSGECSSPLYTLQPPSSLSQTLTRVSPDLLLQCYLGTPTVMDTLLRGLRVGIQPLQIQLVNISFSDLLWAYH